MRCPIKLNILLEEMLNHSVRQKYLNEKFVVLANYLREKPEFSAAIVKLRKVVRLLYSRLR